LVEYAIKDGKAAAQAEALEALIDNLRAEGTEGFKYTAYATDDPTRFIGILEFEDESAKQLFLATEAFATYRAGADERFTAPPSPTPITWIGSTSG